MGLREREREWECEGEEAGRVRMHLHVKSFALCAFYFPQPPLFSPVPFDTPFVDVQRKLVRNESVLGFATGLLLLLLALSPSPTASLSLGVLRFCCPLLYYFLSVFFSVLWQLRKFCATAIFVYCVKAAARNALPRTTAKAPLTASGKRQFAQSI